MEELKSIIRSVKVRLVVLSLIVIAIGVLFLAKPDTSGVMICYLVGILLCLYGIVRLVIYFTGDAAQRVGSFDLVIGAAMLLCGVYILFRPQFLYGILTAVCGIFLVADGVLKLQYAMDLYRMQAKAWWSVLLVALIMIALGLLVLFRPFETMVTLMTFLGVVLIADGVMDLVSISYVHLVAKRVKKAVNDAYTEATAIETDGEVIDENRK